MTLHRAVCADCAWSEEGEDIIELTDRMERHQVKEQHHVDLNKAVAPDGGEEITGLAETDDLDLGTFIEIAEERSRGFNILEEPEEVDLTLVELSASFLDPDGILRTFSITAEGFDPEEYDHGSDDRDPVADGSGGFDFQDSLEYGRTPIGQKTHLIDFETDSALVRGSDSGPDQTLCGRVGDYERAAAPAESEFCDQCDARARTHDIDLEAAADRSKQPVRTDGGPVSTGGAYTHKQRAYDNMTTTGKQRFYDRLEAELEPDVGPVEGDDECEATCEEEAVYRVPWPHIGGDTALCGYHLACYRHDQPEIWERIRSGPFPDPEDFAVVGTRFVSLDEIPTKIRDETFRRVCLDHEGAALFESMTPDADGYVTYIRVNRCLDEFERNRVRKEITGELLGWYKQNIGWRQLDPDVQEALFG